MTDHHGGLTWGRRRDRSTTGSGRRLIDDPEQDAASQEHVPRAHRVSAEDVDERPVAASEVFEEEATILAADLDVLAADGVVARQGDVRARSFAADHRRVGAGDGKSEPRTAVGADQVEEGERREVAAAILLAV